MNKIYSSILFLIFTLLVTLGVTSEAHAMGKHIHYIDETAPDKIYKIETGYPSDDWTRKVIEGEFYKVVIWYPKDHRNKKLPGKQSALFSIRSLGNEKITYQILNYEISNGAKNYVEKVTYDYDLKQKGYQDLSEILNKSYETAGTRPSFNIYSSIPSEETKVNIRFDIEVSSNDGKKARVSETIPLKRSYYQTSFWEGLRP